MVKLSVTGLEALFKVMKDNDVFYFAAQQEKLMLVAINEDQYKSTVDHMLSQYT